MGHRAGTLPPPTYMLSTMSPHGIRTRNQHGHTCHGLMTRQEVKQLALTSSALQIKGNLLPTFLAPSPPSTPPLTLFKPHYHSGFLSALGLSSSLQAPLLRPPLGAPTRTSRSEIVWPVCRCMLYPSSPWRERWPPSDRQGRRLPGSHSPSTRRTACSTAGTQDALL